MSDIRPINIRAEFSSDRKYRYLWEAQISNQTGNGKAVTFLMLNPSTADEIFTDRTINKCLDYVAQWGYGALRVVNLFAYRTSKPEELPNVIDPVGIHNDRTILHAVVDAPLTVCAWGEGGKASKLSKLLKKRITAVRKLLEPYRDQLNLKCLKLNDEGRGEPTHPLNRKLLHKEITLDDLKRYKL